MKTFFLFALTFVLPATMHAQWEKLPLYGGHAEKLVQSKFNPNDIFAITAKSGIWYSSDAGENWKAINGNKSELVGKDINDIEVAKDSSLFITMNRKLFRSRDWGRTWIEKIIRADIQFYESNIEANLNGDLLVYAIKKSGNGTFLFRSIDFSETWFEYPLPPEADWRFTNYSIDTLHPGYLALHGYSGLCLITVDNGVSWYSSTQSLKNYVSISKIKFLNTSGKPIISSWAYNYSGNSGLFWFDYLVSVDSGKSWSKVSTLSAPTNKTGGGDLKIIESNDSSLFTIAWNILYSSSNNGISWIENDSLELSDLVIAGKKLLSSIRMHGFVESTDNGLTWKQSHQRNKISALESIEFVFVDQQTIFASVYDAGYQFRQSTDAGNTWKVLFESPSLHSLQIVSSSPPRYIAVSRNSEIITGTIDQTVPDTLMKGTIIPLYNLRVSATDSNTLFCLAGSTTGRMLYVSTDGGKNWDSTLTPLFDYRYFGLYPSRVIPERVIFIGVLARSIDILGAGVFLSNNYGKSARMIVNEDLKALHFVFFGKDKLFDNWNYSFSTDYGITWVRNDTGLPNDYKQLQAIKSYESGGNLFVGRSADLYQFENGRWVQRTNSRGKNAEWNPPDFVSVVGNDVYASFRYEGLFRFKNALITNTEKLEIADNDYRLLKNFPNPMSSETIITYSLPQSEFGEIFIMNLLGQIIKRWSIEGNDRQQSILRWDGTNSRDEKVPNGTYRCVLRSGQSQRAINITVFR